MTGGGGQGGGLKNHRGMGGVQAKLLTWVKRYPVDGIFFWQGRFLFPCVGDGSHAPIFWIKENRMFGAFAMENTAFSCQMTDEVTAFHEAILEPGFFSSGFPLSPLCL